MRTQSKKKKKSKEFMNERRKRIDILCRLPEANQMYNLLDHSEQSFHKFLYEFRSKV